MCKSLVLKKRVEIKFSTEFRVKFLLWYLSESYVNHCFSRELEVCFSTTVTSVSHFYYGIVVNICVSHCFYLFFLRCLKSDLLLDSGSIITRVLW
jgi:hypothetical protein